MQWGQSFQPVFLDSGVLANETIVLSAHLHAIAFQVFAPSCHHACQFERSFAAVTHHLIGGMSGAGAAAKTGAAALSAPPNFFFLITTVLAIGACLAVASRLRVVHNERNAARNKVASLEVLSERDPLTGLLNRRVVEERFESLRSQGFDTFALIDLDNFKAVNDRYGHQVGDEVLVACGDALRGSEESNYLTMRLGGEEFVVILRGEDAYYRAEALRKRLPLKIARAVPNLEEPVTASMGLIELPNAGCEASSFEELYLRADQLLYNAKASGRDRTCFERLTVFKSAPPRREFEGDSTDQSEGEDRGQAAA